MHYFLAVPIGLLALTGGSSLAAQATTAASPGALAGTVGDTADVSAVVRRALAVNPVLRVARLRAEAARHRIRAAGIRPDPMLMAGLQNLPLSRDRTAGGMAAGTGADPMTMRMVGISQTVPFPGRLSLQRRIAELDSTTSDLALTAARRDIGHAVRDAYYEIAVLDQTLGIVHQNRELLLNLITVTESRYGAGVAGQQDVLRAHLEATRLAETAISISEQRRAEVAKLNAMLDQSGDTTFPPARIPPVIARAALSDSGRDPSFASNAPGSRLSRSPIPRLTELQAAAIRESVDIRQLDAQIAAQEVRVRLAQTLNRPDIDVSLQYGQRTGYADMLTGIISVALPVQRRAQRAQVAAERSDMTSLEAERLARINDIQAHVARVVSDIERDRSQLALYTKALFPQARATLAAATGAYQAGRVEFLTVLESQITLFAYEMEYIRLLGNFAKGLAQLERLVGTEVLQ